MMSQPSKGDRQIYREFGAAPEPSALSRPDPPPSAQTLKIEVSRKGRKGKTVTVISGFQVQAATLTSLVKQLKAQCGTGGTAKENAIEIQGDHCQTLIQALEKLGYRVKRAGG